MQALPNSDQQPDIVSQLCPRNGVRLSQGYASFEVLRRWKPRVHQLVSTKEDYSAVELGNVADEGLGLHHKLEHGVLECDSPQDPVTHQQLLHCGEARHRLRLAGRRLVREISRPLRNGFGVSAYSQVPAG